MKWEIIKTIKTEEESKEIPDPCPFCGANLEYLSAKVTYTLYQIYCTLCSSTGPIISTATKNTISNNLDIAIKNWNARF